MTEAFNENEFEDVCRIINESRNEILNFAGHNLGFDHFSFGEWQSPFNIYKDANKEYSPKDDKTGVTIHSITTEVLMVGRNENKEERVKGIIRIVNITDEKIGYESNKADGEFLSLNPCIYLQSAKEMEEGRKIRFFLNPFYSWRWKTLRYTVDWNDSTPIENHTAGTLITNGELWQYLDHTYDKPGNYTMNVTIRDIDNPIHEEWITQNIIVRKKGETKEPFKIMAPESLIATLWNGADVSENPQNTLEHVMTWAKHSEPKPVADLMVHFENATEDIDLSNITADVNITEKKSVIYMPSWPAVIEPSKILYIPSTGKGAVYICKNATSLEEVCLENADVVINIGETKDGMAVLATLYSDTEYYVVFNVTGTGGGEFATAENIFDTGVPTNPYPSISGTHNGTIKPNQTITVNKLYTYPCPGTSGHTESIRLYDENDTLIANGTWNGYIDDWQNLTIHNVTDASYVTLLENHEYNYVIITGSYPQIHHTANLSTPTGFITCTEFVDANGKKQNECIPAIRLWAG